MKWARIEGDTVREIIDFDPAGRFHPSLSFVAVPAVDEDAIGEGWRYDGRKFAAPPEPEPEPTPQPDHGQAELLDRLADEWEAAATELRANHPAQAADALSRAAETARQSAASLRGESRDS